MNLQIDRISGLALFGGAVAFVLHIVLRSVITAGPEATAFASEGAWVPIAN